MSTGTCHVVPGTRLMFMGHANVLDIITIKELKVVWLLLVLWWYLRIRLMSLILK